LNKLLQREVGNKGGGRVGTCKSPSARKGNRMRYHWQKAAIGGKEKQKYKQTNNVE